MSEQQKPDTQIPVLQELKEALDKSSSINRTLGLSFGVFVFIIAIMVAGTTDLQLFIPDSTFTFPFVNLPLNITYFFIAAPFVVLIMHYNLLYNLLQHSKKLLHLCQTAPGSQNSENESANTNEQESLLLHPFLFNFALTVQNPLHSLALNLVIRTTIFILPLALLFFILIRFADYQSMAISAWHFAAVLLDMALITTHSRSIIQVIKTSEDKLSDEYGWRDFFAFRKGKPRLKNFVVNAGKFFLHIIPATFSTVTAFIIFVAGNAVSLLTRFKLQKRLFITKALDYQLLAYKYLRVELIFAWLAVAFFLFFVYIMTFIIGLDTAHVSLISNIIPRLRLPEEVLVKSQPAEHIKTLYLNTSLAPEERSQKEQEIMLKFTEPYILKGRSFRYADLSLTILTRSDLRDADLTGAWLLKSKMQKGRLDNAKLQGAYLSGAKLQGADLSFAQLQGAYPWNAELQGAKLWSAQLQGAYLNRAQLQGADLSVAELQGANLSVAELQGANLSVAQLQGADLSVAELQGANLSVAQLQGADLPGAQLQGADLRNAQLQGADLSHVKLQGAIFNDTYTKGALFSDSTLDTVLFIRVPFETNDQFYSNVEIDKIALLIQDEELKRNYKTRMVEARNRFENDTLILAEKIPNAKIYRPEDLATDSSFFFIRRRIAAQDKDIAQGMLWSVSFCIWENDKHPIYKSLLTDLYLFLKSNHPDYLEGFEYDEEGEEITAEK